MASFKSLVLSALSGSVLASPFEARQGSPCAAVSAAVATAAPSTVPTVPAQLAYDCLQSVPLGKQGALDLVDAIQPYFRWQSTTAYLKNPPAEYVAKIQDPVDIFGGLADIRGKIESDTYTSEYEFGKELYTLTQKTHDGHLVFVPDVIGEVFNFARPVPLVSVSKNGKSLPQPYVYSDILAESFGNTSFTPSRITKINGQNALKFLEDWSQIGSLQDRDALYNNAFYELAVVSLGSASTATGTFSGGGRGRWVYPGPTTRLDFANGTSSTYENIARVLIPFDGIKSGEDLYEQRFATPAPPTTEEAAAPAAIPVVPAIGYPTPVIKLSNNVIGGYYLEGEGYEDVAVLTVASFIGDITQEIPFQQVGEQFLTQAVAEGKKKLVIDVSANGGGTILQGYDLFKQLFPLIDAFSAADRFRAFESTDLIGQRFSDIAADYPRTLDPEYADISDSVISSVFNYRTDQKPDATPFKSWDEKFGPVPNYGDEFTSYFRWNLSDVLTPLNSGGIYVHGYGNGTMNTTTPFEASNVVVVTDGFCASTCTIFSELMRQLAGVQYISLGGRSKEGITQAIGGVKGTNNFPWTYIQALAQFVIYENTTAEQQAEYLQTELIDYNSSVPFDRIAPGTAANVNFRDGVRKGDESGTPLQFVYEPADCRIYYTKAMTVDASAIWKAAADSKWNGKNRCAAGSVGGGYPGKRIRRESAWHLADALEYHVGVEAREAASALRKRGSSIEDYPLDVMTDLRGMDLERHGWMMP